VIEALDEPKELDPNDTKITVKKAIWDKLITLHVEQLEKRAENMCNSYMLIYGQCSDSDWAKLESMPGFVGMEK
jgi:hypothetical protein